MRSQAKAILWGGLVAGTIDIGAASLINLISPVIILQFIAAGVLGRASLTGGPATAALGLLLQWLMSLVIAAIYVAASHRLAWLKRAWLAGGALYGVAVFIVMTFVVVPLSRAPVPHHPPAIGKVLEDLVAMILFGSIVAWFARTSSTRPSSRQQNRRCP